jgi:DNA-binding NarL/FixJ family response regulator
MTPLIELRILLADMTTMFASILCAALGETPGLTVAGQCTAADDLLSRIREVGADVLIVQSSDPGDVTRLLPLLRDCPTLRVLALTANCGGGFVHELRVHSTRLTDLSAAGLGAAAQGRAAAPWP